jgi:hypothetical protein
VDEPSRDIDVHRLRGGYVNVDISGIDPILEAIYKARSIGYNDGGVFIPSCCDPNDAALPCQTQPKELFFRTVVF